MNASTRAQSARRAWTAGRRLAFRTLAGVPAGLGWVVVAGGPQPSLLTLPRALSPGVLSPLAIALALAVAGAISLRQRHRDEARVLSEAEGGRAEAERRTRTDALTGLYNRRHVLDAVTAELARCERTGIPPSVLMLDLDHFQRINAAYGHAAGDRVLSEVAGRLQGRLRGYDVLGRWGGEEFIVLAPGVPDDATLRSLAEQIRRLIGTLPFASGKEALLPVTVSIGAVRASEALRSVEGLIDCAGRALAAAKRHGRNRAQLFADLTRCRICARGRSPSPPPGACTRARVGRALGTAARRRRARVRSCGRDCPAHARRRGRDASLQARRTVT